MSVNFKKFERAFNKAVDDSDNRLSDGKVNWNFVDADMCLDGWDTVIGEEYIGIFDDLAHKTNLRFEEGEEYSKNLTDIGSGV